MLFNTPTVYIVIFMFTFIFGALTVSRLIPVFSKNAKQPIYGGGPSWHMKKSGTPTMGGLGFVIPITVAGLMLCIPLHRSGNESAAINLFLSVLFALANAAIGVIDDTTKLRRKENRGLSPKEKLFLQIAAVIIFLAARSLLLGTDTRLVFPFGSLELGAFYYLLTAFVLLGIINSANLTDGIDGLASGVAFAAAISIFYVSYFKSPDAAVLSAALAGGTVGFMLFNIHPAKIFMGDTGSLFLGAAIASAALSVTNPIALIGIGGVYVIEGTSVVIQVLVYKLCGRRVFKMAPLHHHLEKSGWSENKICICAIIATLIFSVLTFGVFAV